MTNTMPQMYEYGYYGYNVFEVPSLGTDISRLPKVDTGSKVGITFNVGSRTALVDIDINTGDYYKRQTNEGDYANLFDFIKTNQIGRIPRISSTVKILLYYTITTADGATVDAGARISEVSMEDCVQLLPMVDKIFAPYRISKHTKATFVIDRFNHSNSVNIRTPFYQSNYPLNETHTYTLYIDAIRVLGTELGKDRSIPKSMNGGHYAVGSQTLLDIERNSVELFSSVWYDLKFNSIEIPGYTHAISIPIEVVTPMIVTTDPSEIDAMLKVNSEEFYPGDTPGEIIVDMFKPLIHRPPCPGTLPHDYFKYWNRKPEHCHPGHDHGPCVRPIEPGPEWPNHGCVPKIDVDKIDENTPPGVYSNTGILKYSWEDLVENGAIQISYKGDATVIGTPEQRIRGAKITADDIGPILVVAAPRVTSALVIAESAFFGYSSLEAVYLPDATRVIKPHAFYGCSNLEMVRCFGTGLNGITSIDDNAFMNCTSLRSVSTSLALARIGNRAFYHCSLLTLRIPPSVITVGTNAFHEIFKVICSPKLNLSDTGIDPVDATFFVEGDPWYSVEDTPDAGDDDNGGNSDEPGHDGGDSGSSEPEPENPGGNTGSESETGSGDTPSGEDGKTPETGSNTGTSGGGIGEGEVEIGDEDW